MKLGVYKFSGSDVSMILIASSFCWCVVGECLVCRKGSLSDGARYQQLSFKQFRKKSFFILFLHLFFKFEIFEKREREREREQQAKTRKGIRRRESQQTNAKSGLLYKTADWVFSKSMRWKIKRQNSEGGDN